MTTPAAAPRTTPQQVLIEEYGLIQNPQERLAAIMDDARKHPPIEPEDRQAVFRVQGCVSPVWLIPELRAGHCHFRFDAESPMVRGLVYLVVESFNGRTPADIIAETFIALKALRLENQLSPTRLRGLAAVEARIKAFAQGVG